MIEKSYNPQKVEEEMLEFWKENKTYEKLKKKNKNNKKFYYLDGPPYTTGAIHIGHAWGKALRDSIMRYKRMQGFDVYDRPGFDMHGLPIEVAVEKKFGIKDKKELLEKIGIDNFIKSCREFALEQMYPMINDFKREGVWMEWDNPYMTINNEYIEAVWWALKRAHEKKLLYNDFKTMTWCPRCATALAKHELEYKNVNDKSIFVKFPIIGSENNFLIVWTTTPWTIPFNLAVMVHPDFDYVKIKVENEFWIVAKALSNALFGLVGKDYNVVQEFKGSALEGIRYKTPFYEELDFHNKLFEENKKSYSVLLSEEYVDLSAGTGLVHCAPGCGPEDYEVGKKNNLPAFNLLDEEGNFVNAGSLTGLKAKKDDENFIRLLNEKKLLVAETTVEHEYAHCWRCKTPVVYRATKQWFLTVEKLKQRMRDENKRIDWVPNWAGSKWFDSWLDNLQDWCISRQRFWGIPLPIWVCDRCNSIKLIGSKQELEKLSKQKIEDLHRPWIDSVKLKCSCGAEMQRIEDVLDVWLDSGAASWATLKYPLEQEQFKKLWPADLILEGKDQIRGWFNSLMCLSFVALEKSPYKSVYMHGFINDAQGRKMSKSLKNIISPYEIIDKYGADTMRYYMISGTSPGVDLNYNFDDMRIKFRNLSILWNIHLYLFDIVKTHNLNIKDVASEIKKEELDTAERFIVSRANSAIKEITEKFNKYYLNETPVIAESLFLDLSRKYIRLSREKANKKPETVAKIIFNVLMSSLKIFAPIAPFITEKIYQNIRREFALKDELKEESIHLFEWPSYDETLIDKKLESQFQTVFSIIQAGLSLREKIGLGIRWPLNRLIIVTENGETRDAAKVLYSIIREQLNIKEILFEDRIETHKKVKLNFSSLNQEHRRSIPKIVSELSQASPDFIIKRIEKEGCYKIKDGSTEIKILKENLIIEEEIPKNLVVSEIENAKVILDSKITPELEAEGYARELVRRIQNIRKKKGLTKIQRIELKILCEEKMLDLISSFREAIGKKTGASSIEISKMEEKTENFELEKIRGKEFAISMRLIDD
ncbi:MAG: isoleucine--tRNA ligase [Candidatus Woesearchaeota archaeon]